MKKPKLVIMAAGMGSRYGGLKQIDPIDEYGHIIMDFSVYDAKEAGFEDVVFIIKKENEGDFKETIGQRIENQMNVTYVYQDINNLPQGFRVPEGRIKPWGTGHAILCCADVIDGAFAVINADDFYGKTAFNQMYDYLISHEDDNLYRYAMVGYLLKNTITENGCVSRGVCAVDEGGYLTDIVEKTQIVKCGDDIINIAETSKSEVLPNDCIVSMNLWGFNKSIIDELKKGFSKFLADALEVNPLTSEYYIPTAVDLLLKGNKASVKVLTSQDKWHGVTYKEDKPVVVNAVSELKKCGEYPERLWK